MSLWDRRRCCGALASKRRELFRHPRGFFSCLEKVEQAIAALHYRNYRSMSIQKIPVDAIQKIQKYVQQVLNIPESENRPRFPSSLEELDDGDAPDSLDALGDWFKAASVIEADSPAPNVEGSWFLSSINPGDALLKLPGLRLKPGFRLVTYLNRNGKDGVGATWAVPEEMSTTALLEVAIGRSGDRHQPPHPEGALPDVMLATTGDRSPASFVVASILARELRELGALGTSCNWSVHRLVQALPTQVKWDWQVAAIQDLSPKVRIFPDGRAAVEFFTCRVAAPINLFRHLDQYPANSYQPTHADRVVAIATR